MPFCSSPSSSFLKSHSLIDSLNLEFYCLSQFFYVFGWQDMLGYTFTLGASEFWCFDQPNQGTPPLWAAPSLPMSPGVLQKAVTHSHNWKM